MFRFPVDTDTFLIIAPRWSDLGLAWQIGLFTILLGMPAALILGLYRYELILVSRLHAFGLLALRLLILAALWGTIAFQPHFLSNHVEESPGCVRIAVDLSSSMDVTDAGNTLSRKAIIQQLLSQDRGNLIQRLANRHQVEIVGFHRQALRLTPPQLFDALDSIQPKDEPFETDLRQSLTKVGPRPADPLLGVLLFSDGRHNVGAFDVSKLVAKGTPVFPVVVGPKDPPSDLIVREIIAPTRAFKGTTVAIEVRCKTANLSAQEFAVELQFQGKPVQPEHRRIILHAGKDADYRVKFDTKMDGLGTHQLIVRATSKVGKEITLVNNTMTHYLQVSDDKIKILLIDGDARWEYHYLANALLRDKEIALERVVFVQPRIGAIKNAVLDKAGLPRTKLPEPSGNRKDLDPLLDYDCIVLGDVAPENLPLADRERLERYVSKRGGTLIVVAGKKHMPMNYTGDADPIAKLLPITKPREWRPDGGFGLRMTPQGARTPFLAFTEKEGADVWSDLPKHFWAILGTRKPAASVLLAPTMTSMPTRAGNDADEGILVEQFYGLGRVLFLGMDSTWRWRFRVGDMYHHRFWGQLAHWAAADKLLPAGNHLVRYGAREPIFREGDEIEIAARLSAELPALKDAKEAHAKLLRQNSGGGGEEIVAVVPLAFHPWKPNLLEAKVRDLPQGAYRVELDIPPYRAELRQPTDEKGAVAKEGDRFRILPRQNQEWLDLSANWNLMRDLAIKSGGTLYTPETVDEIVDRLARRIERTEYHDESKPWQDAPMVWWMLGILLGLLTIEWVWRKLVELP